MVDMNTYTIMTDMLFIVRNLSEWRTLQSLFAIKNALLVEPLNLYWAQNR